MQLTYRGAYYSTPSAITQPTASAIGTYRGTKMMLGATAQSQSVSRTLRYRGISYQSAE